MRTPALLLLVALPLLAASTAAPAAAQSPAAQELFDAALELAAKRDFAAACPKFQRVIALSDGAALGARLELAKCWEGAGRLTSAWLQFREVETLASRETDPARQKVAQERMLAARARAEALKGRLSKLVVELSPAARAAPGVQVTRDGQPMPQAELALLAPIDGGEHEIIATWSDGRRWSTKVVIKAEGDSVRVEIPGPPAAPSVAQIKSKTPATPTTPTIPADAPRPVWPFVVGGLGLAALGVGVGFGLDGLAANQTLREQCGPELLCGPGMADSIGGLNARKNTGLGLFIGMGAVGTAGLLAGIVGLATRPGKRPTTSTVHPILLPGLVGVSVRGAF